MRLPGKLIHKSILIIGLPALAQLAMLAVVWHFWPHGGCASDVRLQHKILLGAATFCLLLTTSLFLYFYETIIGDIRRLLDIVETLSNQGSDAHTSYHSQELEKADKVFREMKSALAVALVAAHEGNERQVSEQRLRLSEERISLIVRSIPIGLLVVENSGIIESANPAAQQMFARSGEEFAGLDIAALFQEADGKEAHSFLAELSGQSDGPIKHLHGLNNQAAFPAEVSAQPIETIEGSRHIIMVVDVTQKHEVERLKQEFVAIVSHELRTPLTSIGAFLEMLAAGVFSNDLQAIQGRSKTAGQNVTRLIGLINDLLDLEKMEAGMFEFQMKPVDMASILNNSIDAVREFADTHTIKLAVQETDKYVLGDEERLMQVVINLLSNAIKFSLPGETVRVCVEDENDWLKISVQDTGSGIPDGLQEKIFEKYAQARTDGARKGTGLGLPICKMIVEQHGGTIGVTSMPGKGSTFWFKLRREASPAEVTV